MLGFNNSFYLIKNWGYWDEKRLLYKYLVRNILSRSKNNTPYGYLNKNIKRDLPHILFITNKWWNNNPKYGLANNNHNLLGSLEASGLATYGCFYPDDFSIRNKRNGETSLLFQYVYEKPDFIYTDWPNIPSRKTLLMMKKLLNIPIIIHMWDSVTHIHEISSLIDIIDLCVIVDSSTTKKYYDSEYSEKFINLWSPQDPRVFYNPHEERDIDVSFVGTKYPDRIAGINKLKENNINIFEGMQKGTILSITQYAKTMMHSKIVINYSVNPTGSRFTQLKGRVFESTLCGALLMESANNEITHWFTPFIDYIPFDDDDDLLGKINFYLKNEEERRIIAENGYQKSLRYYNCENYWKTIINIVSNQKSIHL